MLIQGQIRPDSFWRAGKVLRRLSPFLVMKRPCDQKGRQEFRIHFTLLVMVRLFMQYSGCRIGIQRME